MVHPADPRARWWEAPWSRILPTGVVVLGLVLLVVGLVFGWTSGCPVVHCPPGVPCSASGGSCEIALAPWAVGATWIGGVLMLSGIAIGLARAVLRRRHPLPMP